MMQGLHNPEAADAEGQIGEGKKKKKQPTHNSWICFSKKPRMRFIKHRKIAES